MTDTIPDCREHGRRLRRHCAHRCTWFRCGKKGCTETYDAMHKHWMGEEW